MGSKLHPQERRLAKKLSAGARAVIRADGTWLTFNGQERWISSKWIDRMEGHGLITTARLSVFSYYHWELTEAGEALARQ